MAFTPLPAYTHAPTLGGLTCLSVFITMETMSLLCLDICPNKSL